MNREVAYVDSAAEQHAYLVSRFGPLGTWSVLEQRLATSDDGAAMERARLRTSLGDVEVEFRDATTPALSLVEAAVEPDRLGTLDAMMERAAEFARENPPHHPGSLSRFPVPVEHYGRAVGVPMAILAVDGLGRRGLFAPPRMAVIDWDTHEPVGARDVPGFDPERWPPPRLGDWPTPQAARLVPEQLDATIQRFSACWSRVIDAWFADRDRVDAVLAADVGESLHLRRVLDGEAMEPIYRSMNPRFATWLDGIAVRSDGDRR